MQPWGTNVTLLRDDAELFEGMVPSYARIHYSRAARALLYVDSPEKHKSFAEDFFDSVAPRGFHPVNGLVITQASTNSSLSVPPALIDQAGKTIQLCFVFPEDGKARRLRFVLSGHTVFEGTLQRYPAGWFSCGSERHYFSPMPLKKGKYVLVVCDLTTGRKKHAEFSTDDVEHIEIRVSPLDVELHGSAPRYL